MEGYKLTDTAPFPHEAEAGVPPRRRKHSTRAAEWMEGDAEPGDVVHRLGGISRSLLPDVHLNRHTWSARRYNNAFQIINIDESAISTLKMVVQMFSAGKACGLSR